MLSAIAVPARHSSVSQQLQPTPLAWCTSPRLHEPAAVAKGLIQPSVQTSYLRHMIALDFELFSPELARADADFFAAYKASANALLSEATGEDWAASTGKYRQVVWAAMHGSREQTLKLLGEATA